MHRTKEALMPVSRFVRQSKGQQLALRGGRQGLHPNLSHGRLLG